MLQKAQRGGMVRTLCDGCSSVTAILLTSGAAKPNSKAGTVVAAPSPPMVRPGIVSSEGLTSLLFLIHAFFPNLLHTHRKGERGPRA